VNPKQVHKFVERYLDTTGCAILEKSPAHFKVKLSPAADRELTNRPYYWSFVDRTGAEPETMSYLFVTDSAKYDASEAANAQPAAAPNHQLQAGADAALARSFGHVHGTLGARMPREDLHFGSRRLDQLMSAVQAGGKYVCLFQQPDARAAGPFDSVPYTPWLGVNVKVSFQCDMKREELHSFGVSLATGVCVEGFYSRLLGLKMTPRLPANVHIAKSAYTLQKAAGIVETVLERKLKSYDYGWAQAAAARAEEELALISGYYEPLLDSAEEEQLEAIRTQYENRRAEVEWQLKPRVTAAAVNCGIFHLTGIE